MENNKKVGIIGAGVVGLYIAWKLASKGQDVTVFEKRNGVGKEVCSGLFSERILKFIPESKSLIENKITHCILHFPKKTIKIRFSKQFLVMNHSALDKLTLNLAAKAGVKIILNNDIKIDEIHNLAKDFDRIIGSDGALSQTRRALKAKEPNFSVGMQGFTKEHNENDFVEVWPTKTGFFWKIPRGKEVEYGIMEKPERAKAIFEEFVKKFNLKLEIIKAAVIPQGLSVSMDPRFTLCGDASGLTKPWSGGGVAWSLTAADILLKNFPNFIQYQKELKIKFLPRIALSKIITRSVYFFGFNLPWLIPSNYVIESDFLVN